MNYFGSIFAMVACIVMSAYFSATETFDIKLESDSVSVGGWVMEQLNRVPIKGDSFTTQNLEITVSDLSAYRVSFITVRQCDVCLTCEQ